MKFAKSVVKLRIPIIIITLILMVPAALGMINTRVNYDMLDYLPGNIDTIKGQDILMDDFGKGAFSLIVVEDMEEKDVSALKEKIEKVNHTDTVIWYDTLADISIPMDILLLILIIAQCLQYFLILQLLQM